MEHDIRKGRIEELEQIMALIAECIRVMREGGSDQWDESYPNAEIITEDIERGTLYVWEEDGAPAAILVLDENQAEQYGEIEWVQPEGPNLIMHRLAVHPRVQGKGIARRLVAFAENFAAEQGYKSIRMDTYAKNAKALELYRRLGYEIRGEVKFPGRTANFPVMEKILASAG
ncbi:Acetyltransferase (GNAT) family protein [Paenibacillus sophorae]|uniref:Acetyltransferase (GNAT) family protein n=1 Tax=Paenibacillus sophorae TaxID=1333845 RepID=A0A1H8Q7U2_9BACL|nr:GNAT family N-acetyltransferase [Paenibacillus sophorae]QWU15242.1 GNAT family N-acetyltransferase [Paenibacillus sophorae]SEO50004.1 Acetyltransferase (GNAT) family protein [Paenibacillus sophorae]